MSEVAALLEMISKDLIAAKKRVVKIAVAGAQGSGKSTAARAFAKANPRVVHFSLDDVYLATAERKALASTVSPIFKLRGPPGSHDLELAKRTLMRLDAARGRDKTPIPRFDKLKDVRAPVDAWPQFEGTPNVTIVEGWCMGATPQDDAALEAPVNDFERKEDATGAGRAFVNAQLAGAYQPFFDRFDAFVFLAAPSFEVVLDWRTEQEAELRGVAIDKLDKPIRANLERFVESYERLTRHMLAGGRRPGWTVHLDERRCVVEVDEPR
jgi:D-glycerate 3-kinase